MTSRLGIRSIVFFTLAAMLTVAGLIAAIILVRATGTEAEVQLLRGRRRLHHGVERAPAHVLPGPAGPGPGTVKSRVVPGTR